MKKGLKVLGLSAVFALFLTCSASATSIYFDKSVPTAQGYTALEEARKSMSTSYGTVKLSTKEPVAVSFSLRAKRSDGSWGKYQSPTVVSEINKTYNVWYEYETGVGTKVQARVRNHNWSLNSNQIEGVFDYK